MPWHENGSAAAHGDARRSGVPTDHELARPAAHVAVLHGAALALGLDPYLDRLTAPRTLLIAYLAQRTRNTMPALIVHAIFNGMALIPLTLAVTGQLS